MFVNFCEIIFYLQYMNIKYIAVLLYFKKIQRLVLLSYPGAADKNYTFAPLKN